MRFYSFNTKPCIAEVSNVSFHRLRIRDARNPREQSAQLLGQYGPRVKSLKPMPPSLRSILANSRAAAVLSGNVQNAHSQITASKETSGNGSRSASPVRK